MKTILEFIANKKPIKPVGQTKYHPQTKKELIEAIETEFDNGNYDLNCIDTSAITHMSCLFSIDLGKIGKHIKIDDINFDVSGWDVSNVTSMFCMFDGCKKFDCDLSNWDVSNVTDMASMFEGCKEFSGIGLDEWNLKDNVDVLEMFFNVPKIIDKYGITPTIENNKLVKK